VREPSELRLCGKKGARRYVIGASLKYLSDSCSLQLVVVLVCEMHGIIAKSGSPHFPIGVLTPYRTKRFVRRSTLTVITCAFQVVNVPRPSRFQRQQVADRIRCRDLVVGVLNRQLGVPPSRIEEMLWLRAGSQKLLTFMYNCSSSLFFVQKEGFFAGSASNRTTAKSSPSPRLGRGREIYPLFWAPLSARTLNRRAWFRT
jgi:hypothetical protein